MPPSFRARFQRFTEDSEASTISITSPIVPPSSRSRPASRRRVSNSAALPCFLINYYTHDHAQWFICWKKVNRTYPRTSLSFTKEKPLGIFKRISDILSANMNELTEKFEEPEKMLK